MRCRPGPATRSASCSQARVAADTRLRMSAEVEPPPGPIPPRQSQKEATRQRVVASAHELFDTHGYQGTTIREIARHAGVSVGSVFTTFASKGEILSEVMLSRLEP